MTARAFSTLLLVAFAAVAGAATHEPKSIEDLRTAKTEVQTIPREYRLDGIVEAIKSTTVSAQIQGRVEEILYDVDDYVEKNAVLVRLRDKELRAGVSQAAAEIKSASAQLEQAKDEFARTKDLYSKELVSASAMDQATADLMSAEARLEAATAALDQANEQLEYTQIRAPYSGIVTHRHVEPGEVVNAGQPVMAGIALEELRVIVDVPQSVVAAVRNNAHVHVYLPDGQPGATEIEHAASDEPMIEVEKVTVFPFADLGSNTFKVRLTLPPGINALFPGMFVKTGFVVGEKEELVVPEEAVVYRSEVTGVYVIEAGHIQFRQIRLGRALRGAHVVLAGLEAGEAVALDPIAAGSLHRAQLSDALTGNDRGGH